MPAGDAPACGSNARALRPFLQPYISLAIATTIAVQWDDAIHLEADDHEHRETWAFINAFGVTVLATLLYRAVQEVEARLEQHVRNLITQSLQILVGWMWKGFISAVEHDLDNIHLEYLGEPAERWAHAGLSVGFAVIFAPAWTLVCTFIAHRSLVAPPSARERERGVRTTFARNVATLLLGASGLVIGYAWFQAAAHVSAVAAHEYLETHPAAPVVVALARACVLLVLTAATRTLLFDRPHFESQRHARESAIASARGLSRVRLRWMPSSRTADNDTVLQPRVVESEPAGEAESESEPAGEMRSPVRPEEVSAHGSQRDRYAPRLTKVLTDTSVSPEYEPPSMAQLFQDRSHFLGLKSLSFTCAFGLWAVPQAAASLARDEADGWGTPIAFACLSFAYLLLALALAANGLRIAKRKLRGRAGSAARTPPLAVRSAQKLLGSTVAIQLGWALKGAVHTTMLRAVGPDESLRQLVVWSVATALLLSVCLMLGFIMVFGGVQQLEGVGETPATPAEQAIEPLDAAREGGRRRTGAHEDDEADDERTPWEQCLRGLGF